jgi:dTDP-4-dehydrorhamnose 3,5-epimerase
VQDNVSTSRRGVLRGLHYQWPNPQGKLVHVLDGSVFDVAVDLRVGSPTFGAWVGAELSAENHRQLWVPPGFGHGFAVTSDRAVFVYKVTALYDAAADRCIRWNDPAIAVEWPVTDATLSPRDASAPLLRDVPEADLPR